MLKERIEVVRWVLVGILSIGIFQVSFSQIRINELVSSNSEFLDEDGATPDWFELYNEGSTPVDLTGWGVSDRLTNPHKWVFPELTLAPGSYLLVWASGKDILTLGYPRTVANIGDTYRYVVPASPVDATWRNLGYDDSSWASGNSGFGYSDGDDATIIGQTISVFARKTFQVSNLSAVQELILDMDYDDAFIAFINGTEVARSNVSGNPPAYNTTASAGHEANLYRGGIVERFVIPNPQNLLVEGENVLAIQGHNVSSSSSDLTLIPFLSVVNSEPSNDGVTPPDLLQLKESYLHTNFKLSSSGETLYLHDNGGVFVDSLQTPALPADVSYGYDGSEFVLYETPTPGEANAGNSYIGRVETEILFSVPGGLTNATSVSLSGVNPPEVIRYTLDATEPTANSPEYTGVINFTGNLIVRAAVFRDGYLPSPIQTETYIRNSTHELPVISLVTEPDNFFHPNDGIYVLQEGYSGNFPYFGSNIWEDWERPIHFSFFEPTGELGTSFDAGVKIFGGWSRAQDQRSLSIFARGAYGTSEIDYPLFPEANYSKFQAVVLRNSGNDWMNTMIRDLSLTSMMRSADLEIQSGRSTAVYINGEYWGIYNLREKINEHYLSSRHQIPTDEINLVEANSSPIFGDNSEYVSLIQFVNSNNLVSDTNYEFVAGEVDIDNYVIYQVAQIYFDNTDWPGNNIKYWKPDGGKWRWILFDTDFGYGIWNRDNFTNNTLAFALDANGPGWPNPPWSTLLFRRLITNTTFRHKFINQFADELNSRFLPENVKAHIDSVANEVDSEINLHYPRWGGTYNNWKNNVENMKYFGNNRAFYVKQHIKDHFNLPGIITINLTNSDPEEGYIRVNSLTLTEQSWSGDYFESVPIKISAVAYPGYTFSHWSGAVNSTIAEIELDPTQATNLEAHFEPTNVTGLPIVINEINYNSGTERNTGDWFELYNPNTDIIDLSGWEVKDSDDLHSFILPNGTLIDARGYLVITRDLIQFNKFYSFVDNVVGNFDFGLSSDGDAVRIYNDKGILQDEVSYLSVSPWPETANGTGSTLELTDPFLDNSLPESWESLHALGSPGRSNFIISSTQPKLSNVNIQHFPNPTTDHLTVLLDLESNSDLTLTLLDLNGREVHEVHRGNLGAGAHEFNVLTTNLPQGMYLLKYTDEEGDVKISKVFKANR